MKLGISSYSLHQAVKSGELSFIDVIHWVKEAGAEHIEIVPLGFDLLGDEKLVDEIRSSAKSVGIELSNYAIGANFLKPDDSSMKEEIDRVKQHVDVAAALGVRLMRHDVASRPIGEATIEHFYHDLPALVDACREVSEYAAKFGIVTSVENHGFHLQASDRVKLLVSLVGRENFRTTLDVGNFLCVDEDPVSAVKNNIGIASMVHVKDFYLRPEHLDPGEGWFRTNSGQFLRGAIAGQGDMDLRQILKIIKQSGYDGFLSLEFEGLEECRFGTAAGFNQMKRLWEEA